MHHNSCRNICFGVKGEYVSKYKILKSWAVLFGHVWFCLKLILPFTRTSPPEYSPKTFIKFPEPPIEIQDIIWCYDLPNPWAIWGVIMLSINLDLAGPRAILSLHI
jgi:hypothetical protein